MGKHTALPWHTRMNDICATDKDDGDDIVIAAIGQTSGFRSAQFGLVKAGTVEGKENAAFIVIACNAYYALQQRNAALSAALKRIAEGRTSQDFPKHDNVTMFKIARAALAANGGGDV